MFRSLFKLSLSQSSNLNNGVLTPTHLLSLHFSSSKPFSAPFSSTTAAATLKDSTANFLVNELSLSPEAANAFVSSKRVRIARALTSNITYVVSILKDHGFTPTHISRIVTAYPPILLAKPELTVKLKLDYLSQNGISGKDLVYILSQDPRVFERSLCNQIIPCISFLRDFLGSIGDVVNHLKLKRGTWVLHRFTDSMVVNVETLRKYKVPDSNILKMMTLRPTVLARECNEFDQIVKKIFALGFDPQKFLSIYAISAFAIMREDKWNAKKDVFKSFGRTDDQLKIMFLKQPQYMNSSEEHLRKALELFSKELEWGIEQFMKYPKVLFLSLNQRILPRMEVMKILVSKGLVGKRVGNLFMVPDILFMEKYVMAHIEEVPQLLEIYRKEMNSVTAK